MAKLTPKQEKFCQSYLELGNASDAYRHSYDTTRMKEATINRNAKALLDHNKIATRISELQNDHQHRHKVTVDDLLGELEAVKTQALSEGNLTVAYNVIMGKAKILGLAKQAQVEIELKKIELERLKLDKGIQPPDPVQIVVEVKDARRHDRPNPEPPTSPVSATTA